MQPDGGEICMYSPQNPARKHEIQHNSCWSVSLGYFFTLPLELRLDIYKLALPAHKFFAPLRSPDFQEFDLALVTTCRMIYQEAYPVFLATNIFTMDWNPEGCGPEPRSWFDNVREMKFDWYTERIPVCGRLNGRYLQDLYEFSQLQTVHVELVTAPGYDIYERYKANYRDEEAKKAFLEDSCIKVVLSIPRVRKLTVAHSVLDNTPDLVALGEYITEQLTVLNSSGQFKAESSSGNQLGNETK